MKYTIGEFASLIGVTTDTLRLYEKKGIIAPYKDEENAYRYYSDLDVRQVLMSRWYRSLRIPLERVSEMTNDYSHKEIEQTLGDQALVLQEKIEQLQRVKSCIDETLHAINEVNTFHKMYIPAWYRMSQTRENTLHKKEKKTTTAKGLMDLLPLSFFTCMIHMESFNTQWGLAIEAEKLTNIVKETYKIDDAELEYYSEALVMRTTMILKGEQELDYISISGVLRQLSNEGHDVNGKPIMAKLLFTDGLSKHIDNKTAYVQLYIPITEDRTKCS